ncbi:MAG: CFI-box-CTERM domain-containing protein [Bdellovibrionota bacterium]
MPSKSVSLLLEKTFKNTTATAIAIFFFHPAFATVTVAPANGGSTVGGIAYYAVVSDTITSLNAANNSWFYDIDPNYNFPRTPFNISRTAETDTSGRPNIFLFNLSSNKSFSLQASEQLVLMITVNGTASGKSLFVPITTAGSDDCTDATCQAKQQVATTSRTHYFAAKYTQGSQVQIGFYPSAICQDFVDQGETPSACESVGTLSPGSAANNGSAKRMTLTFGIYKASNSTDSPDKNATALDTGELGLNFQVDAPNLTCPDLKNIYFPGDTEIFVTANTFANSMGTGTGTFASGRAPATTLIVAGNDGAAADVTSQFNSNNALISRVGINDSQVAIGGFKNTTNGSDNSYQIGFMVRDATGLIASSNCAITGIQTSAIQGFLQKSDCFIASAAFMSTDGWPINIFRNFRDNHLKKYKLGRLFVRYYYQWSPHAAAWILKNPITRLPVLTVLIPIEASVWLILNMPLLIILQAAAALLYILIAKHRHIWGQIP